MWPKRKEDTEQLYANTRTLLENFKPSKVSAYITSTASESDQNAQSAVYSIINEANEMAGKIQSTQCTCLHHAYMHVHTHACTYTCTHLHLH